MQLYSEIIFAYYTNAVMLICLCLGISVVLDLTPNYKGSKPWFSSTLMTNVVEKVKV